jgi:hypothetical protein
VKIFNVRWGWYLGVIAVGFIVSIAATLIIHYRKMEMLDLAIMGKSFLGAGMAVEETSFDKILRAGEAGGKILMALGMLATAGKGMFSKK